MGSCHLLVQLEGRGGGGERGREDRERGGEGREGNNASRCLVPRLLGGVREAREC